ncbi:MAG TPA: helix-turn-helix domain-containing protein [Pseudonocardiaceae bacterium]|nr:helix-turn-helix domain-containing protein [Pseudonocardiaceae bacterium]
MTYRRAEQPGDPPPIDPELYQRDDLRAALARHDFATVYRALVDEEGLSQRRIATLTGQAQSDVSDILGGRHVHTYSVLRRIVTGLGIPPELAGLSTHDPADPNAYAERVTVAGPEGVEELLRRQFEHLLALGAAAAFGGIVPGVGKLVPDLPVPGLPATVPSRIGVSDVAVLRDYLQNLRTVARTHGGQARGAVTLTDWADQWLAADASDTTRRALLAELAHLHTVTAWCCHDGGAPTRALYHFGRAVELATQAGDAYQAAFALRHAAMMLIHRDRPNDALKTIQLGAARLRDAPPDDPRVAVLSSWCDVVSAFALSRLDDSHDVRAQARTALSAARDGWAPPHAHAQADMDLITGWTWLYCGHLDAAEAAVTGAVRTFGQSGDLREGVVADITRARLHVITGDPGALQLAEAAIRATAQTHSGVARQVWLPPLADALDTRPGSDARDLARQARHVATTRV